MKSISALKYIWVIIGFSLLQFSCNTAPKKAQDNVLTFKLEVPQNASSTNTKFEPKEYTMSLQGAFVMNGENSGLNLSWFYRESDVKKINLNIFLPSGPKFKVWVKKEPDVIYTIPTLPFTISSSDNKGSDTLAENKAYFYMKRDYTDKLGYIKKTESVTFSEFAFTVKELNFDRNSMTMRCNFKGSIKKELKKLYDADYSISGEFSIKDYHSGIMDTKDK
ncbi:MAG: hypothetical protein ABR968_05735 [Bacteroidales bacterium]|jgi:hypothetical protein